MAIDSFMTFTPYTTAALDAESQVDLSNNKEELAKDFAAGKVFEVEDFSFDVEQQLNIGSQSSGTGAGKITFNPFSITRKIDKASSIFFEMACAGTAFQTVSLGLRKSSSGGGGDAAKTSGFFFLRFDFKLCAVKTISWSHDDESPKEEVTFEYGGLLVRYCQQNPDGSMKPAIPGGWNRVKNIRDQSTTALPAAAS